ncbi:VWA domain-containing protein [Dinoroseobacter sp. PD6]|uniref:nitric oxide reductase activation protein NorD n=1 Tax=Dinoroseobacter sp. PD6 TaxID=3028384 RepID=UPI00237C465F|nr:VWA domain-containing protein [Dinoroseobacter sp. PD6]MDD9717945.1 VWA domain-containing protein [Dinoroseobacter sp. PD6]
MSKIEIEPWEPEETVGKLWHALASRLDAPEIFSDAAVELTEISGRLAVFFRGLGGDPAVEFRAAADEAVGHRLSWRRRLGTETERHARASFDGEALRLPERLAVFPMREANAALYLWLTAAAAHAPDPVVPEDPFHDDIAGLQAAKTMLTAACAECPGLVPLFGTLAEAALQMRRDHSLPPQEAATEAVIRRLLGHPAPLQGLAAEIDAVLEGAPLDTLPPAARRYRPHRPVPLWPDLRPVAFSARSEVETRDTDGPAEEGSEKTHRARRRKSEQAERQDSLILHKFEAILSFAEFLNLNRRVDDDDNDDAKKAADDLDEIGLGQISKAPATKLKLHLDLAPEDADREALSDVLTYPEWEARSGSYLPHHARVLASWADPVQTDALRAPDAHRRIEAVRRQFEALRPGRVVLPGQPEGEELDMEACVRAQVDLVTRGAGSERIWRQTRPQARDLAVSILLDVSRSTESAVAGRQVIDIEREALTALAWGLQACGDEFAIDAFSSLRRDRVYLTRCKGFGTPMNTGVEARIASLRPGFYTRMGAAIRHASAGLARQARKRRLLLVITDGKPNDLDHYEGRHGVEDTRMAVREARRQGHAVFAITIDSRSKASFTRMFGAGGFSVVPDPNRLIQALPAIYRQLIGA